MTDWTLETAKHELLQVCDYRDDKDPARLENSSAFQWLCAHVNVQIVEIRITDLDEVQELLLTGAQWRKAGGEAILEREELRNKLAHTTTAVEEMRLIKALTQHEVSSVTIRHPNPDFDGPAYAIEYTSLNFVTGETPIYRYVASTLLECLQQAAREHLTDD